VWCVAFGRARVQRGSFGDVRRRTVHVLWGKIQLFHQKEKKIVLTHLRLVCMMDSGEVHDGALHNNIKFNEIPLGIACQHNVHL